MVLSSILNATANTASSYQTMLAGSLQAKKSAAPMKPMMGAPGDAPSPAPPDSGVVPVQPLNPGAIALGIFFAIVIMIVLVILSTLIIQVLWNYLVSTAFPKIPRIGFFQALGLKLLLEFLLV